MRFFTGLHQPSDAKHFDSAFISVNRLRKRKGPFEVGDWIMDSGAFTEISTHGHYRHNVDEYASEIRRWARTITSTRAMAASTRRSSRSSSGCRWTAKLTKLTKQKNLPLLRTLKARVGAAARPDGDAQPAVA